MHRSGRAAGVAEDHAEAARCFSSAAALGHVGAMFNLGGLLHLEDRERERERERGKELV